jgi:hypothetical protein
MAVIAVMLKTAPAVKEKENVLGFGISVFVFICVSLIFTSCFLLTASNFRFVSEVLFSPLFGLYSRYSVYPRAAMSPCEGSMISGTP